MHTRRLALLVSLILSFMAANSKSFDHAHRNLKIPKTNFCVAMSTHVQSWPFYDRTFFSRNSILELQFRIINTENLQIMMKTVPGEFPAGVLPKCCTDWDVSLPNAPFFIPSAQISQESISAMRYPKSTSNSTQDCPQATTETETEQVIEPANPPAIEPTICLTKTYLPKPHRTNLQSMIQPENHRNPIHRLNCVRRTKEEDEKEKTKPGS